MTMVALATAQLLADDVDAWGMPVLRALLPLAGMTLIEQQAERARANGVAQLLVLVDGVPPALAEACDRIRSRGLPVDLVRSGADVVRLAGGHDRILLVADGLIAGDTAWKAATSARPPTLLVTSDVSVTQGLERIDAMTRWAGLAMLPIESVQAIETAPRDWDAQLLLFRSAVQNGAPRLSIDAALFVSGDMMVAQTSSAVQALERRLLVAQADNEFGIGRRFVFGPLVRLAAGPLLGSQRSGMIARIVSIVTFVAAAGAFLVGLPWAGVSFAFAGLLSDEAGRFVGSFRAEGKIWTRVGQVGVAVEWLALLIAERDALMIGSSAGQSGWIGEGIFPLTVLVAVAATSGRRLHWLIDDAAAWVLAALIATVLGWQAALDWTAMVAVAALGLSLSPVHLPQLPRLGRSALSKKN